MTADINDMKVYGMIVKDKLAVVINGKGGAGKDTLCETIGRFYKCINVSSITPIKQIALQHGWNGEKDLKSRKFLADLKRTFADYNDLPNQYLVNEYNAFLKSGNQVMFVHIREKDQIERFKQSIGGNCITLLITRSGPGNNEIVYGNDADDLVEGFEYDYCYQNYLPLEEAKKDFLLFFQGIIKDLNLDITPVSDLNG